MPRNHWKHASDNFWRCGPIDTQLAFGLILSEARMRFALSRPLFEEEHCPFDPDGPPIHWLKLVAATNGCVAYWSE